MSDPSVVPAAQYVRMSTEHQQYSMPNQITAIKRYAASQGFFIVRTYKDSGKSGLTLKGRAGLQSLLKDVGTGEAPYKAILLYDVSRWGRFQDTDEGAHYEYICKRSGVTVHYCAEEFLNDSTVSATGSAPNATSCIVTTRTAT